MSYFQILLGDKKNYKKSSYKIFTKDQKSIKQTSLQSNLKLGLKKLPFHQ